MIDLHFHALPGVDDGPAGWDDALALCRAAAAEGSEIVVATPHVLREPWLNEDPAARAALLGELNAKLGGTPRVLEGSEVWFGDDLVDLLEKGAEGPLTTLAGSRALLVERGAVAQVTAASFLGEAGHGALAATETLM